MVSRKRSPARRRAIGALLALIAGCELSLLGIAGGGERAPQRAGASASLEPARSAPGCATSACHADLAALEGAHAPVRAGACEHCHEPVENATPLEPGARHQFRRAADRPELCYRCHPRYGAEAHVHAPVAQGLCVLCHDPHGGRREFLLRAATDRELCSQCHREVFDQGPEIHGPVASESCGACHDPHESAQPFRMRGRDEQRCGLCHAAEVGRILASDTVHPPALEGCANCHEPHQGVGTFRLIATPPGLCLDCHPSMAERIAHGTSVHPPVAEGRCTDCHDPHASGHRRMLRGNFTDRFHQDFTPGSYELCHRCHDPAHELAERTTTATAFRDGDRNLHFVHVNRESGGRSCNFCHDVHASDAPRLTSKVRSFGLFELRLDLQLTPTGGSCGTACHEPRAYDRVTPVRPVPATNDPGAGR